MARIGNLYGPDATFLGVPAADLDEPASWQGAGAVILGAPFDGGTSHRSGCRFGPQAIRITDYLPHDGMRPHLALGVDPLTSSASSTSATSRCPRARPSGRCAALEAAVASVAARRRDPGRARRRPHDRAARRHGRRAPRRVGPGVGHPLRRPRRHRRQQFGSLHGHGTPMRRLIESGACRGDRFLQIGLRGYWPEPETLAWMAEQGMRSFEMTEVVARGLDAVLDEAFALALDDCDAVFLSVDVDVVDPGSAPGTGTPEPGGLDRASCSTPCAASPWSCRSPASTSSRSPRPTTTPRSPPTSPTASCSRLSRRHRLAPRGLAGERRQPGEPLLAHRRRSKGRSRASSRGSRRSARRWCRGAGRRSGRRSHPPTSSA